MLWNQKSCVPPKMVWIGRWNVYLIGKVRKYGFCEFNAFSFQSVKDEEAKAKKKYAVIITLLTEIIIVVDQFTTIKQKTERDASFVLILKRLFEITCR